MARKRSEVVSVRFTADETAALQAAAQAEHSTISEYIRGCAGRAALLARPGARSLRTQAGAELVVWSDTPDLWAVS